jgi:hypothetical protein
VEVVFDLCTHCRVKSVLLVRAIVWGKNR